MFSNNILQQNSALLNRKNLGVSNYYTYPDRIVICRSHSIISFGWSKINSKLTQTDNDWRALEKVVCPMGL